MSSGIYSPGSIQVRAFTDDNFSESTPMESMILPYNLMVTSVELNGVNYKISGTGQMGASVTINAGGTSQTVEIDEYGYFEMEVPVFTESPFLISMSDQLLSTSQQAITLPPIYPSSQAYNLFDQISLSNSIRILDDNPDDEVMIVNSEGSAIIPVTGGIREYNYSYDDQINYVLINGTNTGYAPDPIFLEVNLPRTYIAGSNTPIILTVNALGGTTGVTTITSVSSIDNNIFIDPYQGTEISHSYDNSSIQADTNYQFVITARDNTGVTTYRGEMHTIGSNTPRNAFIDYNYDGTIINIYITDLDSAGFTNIIGVVLNTITTLEGTVPAIEILATLINSLTYDPINRLAYISDLNSINSALQTALQNHTSPGQLVTSIGLVVNVSIDQSSGENYEIYMDGLYIPQ